MGRVLVFHSKTFFIQISSILYRHEVQSVVAHLESALMAITSWLIIKIPEDNIILVLFNPRNLLLILQFSQDSN